MPDENMPKLVVIDDEPDMARLIADVADLCGYQVERYYSARQFLAEYHDDTDVVFLDLIMPEMSGMNVIDFLIEKKSKARLVLMTGYDTDVLQTARQKATSGSLDLVIAFKKPFRFDELKAILENLKIMLQA